MMIVIVLGQRFLSPLEPRCVREEGRAGLPVMGSLGPHWGGGRTPVPRTLASGSASNSQRGGLGAFLFATGFGRAWMRQIVLNSVRAEGGPFIPADAPTVHKEGMSELCPPFLRYITRSYLCQPLSVDPP